MTDSSPYALRDRRAVHLLAALPHAAEILGFYRAVLARQEPLYDWTLAEWPGHPRRRGADPAELCLEGLPFADLSDAFHSFVRELGEGAVGPLALAATRLGGAPSPARQDLLRRTVSQESADALAATLEVTAPRLAFFARSFLQPIAEALAAGGPEAAPSESPAPSCPRCGWPPQVAVVRDEAEIRGRRLLVCGLCATWWPYPRGRCPSCGEADAKKLELHTSEALPHLRVEECASCRAYIKSVDLRRDGLAVPLVEDIASVELDVWSEERGLWKISRNLLGL